jgi:hypothetical protein
MTGSVLVRKVTTVVKTEVHAYSVAFASIGNMKIASQLISIIHRLFSCGVSVQSVEAIVSDSESD